MVAKNTPPGPGIDASGQTVIDPTKNVKATIKAETKRQDDLRCASEKSLRREMKMAAHYERELRKKETARLDSIRKVDVDAVAAAAQVQATAATALAAQVATTAEAARAALAAAASSMATSLRAEIEPLQKDIASLRQSQYEGLGAKAQTVEARDTTGSNRAGLGLAVAVAAVISSLMLGLTGIVITLLLR